MFLIYKEKKILLLFISINSKAQNYRKYWVDGNLKFDEKLKGYSLNIGIEDKFLEKK